MHDETEPMHLPHKPSWFLTNITLGNVILLVTIVFGAGIAWSQVGGLKDDLANMRREQSEWQVDRDKETAQSRSNIDAQIASLVNKTQPIDGIMYRVGKVEGNIDFINGRIDRVVDAMQNAINPLTREINQLTTKVEVLSAAIDRISPPRRRTELLLNEQVMK